MNTSTQIGKSRIRIRLTVNGEERDVILTNPLSRLLDVLRDDLGLTGTKEGCGEGECGACSVLLNGKLVNSCLVPAAQVDGAVVLTPEGLAETDGGRLLAECFHRVPRCPMRFLHTRDDDGHRVTSGGQSRSR
jgi:aerobic-type carbon monoxide dehydrogenase small subunit (CoxS/CutS family)